MTTAATGCISKAEERIGEMLANCSEFQTWTGTANATAAADHIYYDSVPPLYSDDDVTSREYNEAIRPFALVWTRMTEGLAMNELLGASGTVMVRFEQNTPSGLQTEWEEDERLFKNTLGGILQSGDTSNPGLWELSITRQYTQITQMRLMALYRTGEDEIETYGDAQAAEVSIAWGVTR